MRILALNCGSATVKYALFRHPPLEQVTRKTVALDESGHRGALERVLGEMKERPDAVVHRVVHGGPRLRATELLDDDVEREIATWAAFAPLHNAPALAGIDASRALRVPMVAAFDTAFHRTIPDAAARYAAPAVGGLALRRFGFHGLSHRYVTQRYAELTGSRAPTIVTLHLGGGASATAVRDGVSVDTSMGLGPLEGLVMSTRAGDLDPTIVLHCLRAGHSLDEIESWLYHECGLRGIAGTGDMRALLARDDAEARLAIDVYCYRVKKYAGAYLAALDGRAEAVVFTGGIGENSSEIRRRCVAGLEWAGLELDLARNERGSGRISTDASRLHAYVIATDEERVMAEEGVACLSAARA